MSMTSQPGQRLAGDGQPREPGGRVLDQRPRVRAGLRAGAGDPVQHAGVPARSRARRTVGPLGAAPSTGARCASTAMSLMLVAPSAIAAASETSTTPRSSSGDVPFLPQRGAQARGKSRLVRGLPEQDRAGVADQARPVRGDLQGMVPPVMLHGEERSGLELLSVVTGNLPDPGRSSPSKPKGTAAPRPSPCHSRVWSGPRTHKVHRPQARHPEIRGVSRLPEYRQTVSSPSASIAEVVVIAANHYAGRPVTGSRQLTEHCHRSTAASPRRWRPGRRSAPSTRWSPSPTRSGRWPPSTAPPSPSKATTSWRRCWPTWPRRSARRRSASRRGRRRPTTPQPCWPPAASSPCSTRSPSSVGWPASTRPVRWRSTVRSSRGRWATRGPSGSARR